MMNFRFKNIDTIFLVIFSLASIYAIAQALIQGYQLSLNNYAAFLLLAVMLIINKIRKGGLKPAVVILLILSSFNFTNFFVGQTNIHINDNQPGGLVFNQLGIEPIWLLLLVVYCFLNFDKIKLMIGKTQPVQETEKEKLINFYYDKYSQVHPDEYRDAIHNIGKYPEEVQTALQRLESENTIN